MGVGVRFIWRARGGPGCNANTAWYQKFTEPQKDKGIWYPDVMGFKPRKGPPNTPYDAGNPWTLTDHPKDDPGYFPADPTKNPYPMNYRSEHRNRTNPNDVYVQIDWDYNVTRVPRKPADRIAIDLTVVVRCPT